MENSKKIVPDSEDLFVKFKDEMSKACERAVREALLMHKKAGNSIAVSRDGKVVILKPDEIEVG